MNLKVQFDLSEADYALLKRVAAHQKCSVGDIIREAVDKHVADENRWFKLAQRLIDKL